MNQSAENRDMQETDAGSGRGVRKPGKQELKTEGEQTSSGRFYVPDTDICETEDRLFIIMDMPGVTKDSLAVTLEDNLLSVEGKIDLSNYRDLKPIYTEYNVGHFARTFSLSSSVNQDNIVAHVSDGVLRLELEKASAKGARRITVE